MHWLASIKRLCPVAILLLVLDKNQGMFYQIERVGFTLTFSATCLSEFV